MIGKTSPYGSSPLGSTAWNPRTSGVGGIGQGASTADERLFAFMLARAHMEQGSEHNEGLNASRAGEGGPVILEARRTATGLSAQFPVDPSLKNVLGGRGFGQLESNAVWHVVDTDPFGHMPEWGSA